MPGDGVGVEVMEALKICLDALKFDAAYAHGDIGWEFWRKEGEPFPERTIDLLKASDAATSETPPPASVSHGAWRRAHGPLPGHSGGDSRR